MNSIDNCLLLRLRRSAGCLLVFFIYRTYIGSPAIGAGEQPTAAGARAKRNTAKYEPKKFRFYYCRKVDTVNEMKTPHNLLPVLECVNCAYLSDTSASAAALKCEKMNKKRTGGGGGRGPAE